jgi:uncharacterized glyoxalase superfamily protein PhnB/predicted enzyme related to lactoylglutathione lyase
MTHPQRDPLDALRIGDGPFDPDPAFAAALRAHVERALLNPVEEPMTSTLAERRTGIRLHTITPRLTVTDARRAVEFCVAAFGAARRNEPVVMPDGRIGHAELALGDSVVMISDEWPEDGLLAPVHRGGPSVSLRLETPDPDAVVAAALGAGATLERPVTDEPYGRGGVVVDADGHRWIVARGVPTARPGDVVYASLWAPDPERTRRFFGDVIGDLGPLGTAAGAMATLMCCYEVLDVDAAVALVRAAGGTADEPRDEPHGRTVDCVDDQGIPFALHTGPGTPPPAGPLTYVELQVPDEGRARAFYGTVLGWGFQPGTEPGYWHPLGPEGGFAAPMTGLVGGAAQARVVPAFQVPDLAAAVADVRAAGGEAADPGDRGYGGATCVDDQGTPFHLLA